MTNPNATPRQCTGFVPDAPRAPGLCATCGDDRRWHRATPAPLSPVREAELRKAQLGDCYTPPWIYRFVEPGAVTFGPAVPVADAAVAARVPHWQIVHEESGTVLAVLPGDAGPLVQWMLHSRETGDDLLAELDRVRVERDELKKRVAELEAERHSTNDSLAVVTEAFRAAETERDGLKQRLHEAAMTKTWTNEDGKKFVFVEDIALALLGRPAKGGVR